MREKIDEENPPPWFDVQKKLFTRSRQQEDTEEVRDDKTCYQIEGILIFYQLLLPASSK